MSIKVDNKMNEYYSTYLPGVKPLELYNNTKFLTANKINGGLLSEEEIEKLALPPTGHCFDLEGSGYFVLDLDVNESFKYRDEMDISEDAKLLGCTLTELPQSIQITEYTMHKSKSTVKSTNDALIVLCELFDTRFVKTPSKSFHFYFINDLTEDQMKDVFGVVKPKYIKCFSLFNNTIDVDIFMDTRKESDIEARLVLSFSKILTENKLAASHPNVKKNIMVQYSGVREYKTSGFKKASSLLKWLKNYVTPLESHGNTRMDEDSTYGSEHKFENKIPLDVFESDKQTYLGYMRKNFKIIGKVDIIKTYGSYPFNSYLIVCVIAFFPISMHFDLLRSFIDSAGSKLSENAKNLFLKYYYEVTTLEKHRKNWKGPQYLEAIIDSRFNTGVRNRYRFIYQADKMEREESSEEVLEEEENQDCFNNQREIVKAIHEIYKDFPLPNGFDN